MACRPFSFLALVLAARSAGAGFAATYEPVQLTPPAPLREFRAAWVATVANIDWPSRPGLPAAEQKAEMASILDRAQKIGLNAVILQVRPACDALYASELEPWSEYLTGTMGKPPEPFYDPLAFAVEQAHQRGLELHAWFNPYRARQSGARSLIAASHISKTRPNLVHKYGSQLWLDPGEPEVQQHSLNVVLDVVRRYDVDGVHFDDYFYPYKESVNGRELDFPDDASWRKSGADGKVTRDDWRRENVNRFIERVQQSVHATKPWVKFGVSPFGIWRPGNPAQIQGFDPYDKLYADARLWLRNGWVDYFAPQLYWAIDPPAQSFPVLLNWWNGQNPRQRHIWPGMDTTKVRDPSAAAATRPNSGRPRPVWKPDEIVAQIRLAQKQTVSAGHIHWNARSLLRSSELQAALARGPYASPALVPEFPWLNQSAPARPRLEATAGAASLKLNWSSPAGDPPAHWLLQWQRAGQWTTQVLPAKRDTQIVDGPLPDVVALTAVNRVGQTSPAAVLKLKP